MLTSRFRHLSCRPYARAVGPPLHAVHIRTMNVSASVDAGKAAPGSTVLIKSFDDLRPHMKGFLRRVHPDTIHGENDTVKDQNHESLLLLDAMFKGLEARCELCARPKKGAGSLPTISDVYQLKFFWIDRSAKDALSVMSYKASMPMSLDGQTRLVVSRAVASTTLHNEWLHVAATHMGKLLSGVGVPSDLRGPRPVDKSKPRLFKNRDSRPTVDMTALMRENLIDHSPLQQGKRAPFPIPRPLTDGQSHSYSHFKPRQREDRIVSLFGPNSRHRADPHLPEVDAQAGKARLAQFLLAYFDRFWLYHDAWYSITLVLSRVYLFVPETRSLYLPVDFKTSELGAFLDSHLPALLHEATVNAKAKSKRTNAQAP